MWYTRAKDNLWRGTMIEITLVDKREINLFAKEMFSILAHNMREIAPSSNTYEQDFAEWSQLRLPEIEQGITQTIFIRSCSEIIGYFQYSIREGTLLMEDIQLKPQYHGKYNIFKNVYGYILPNIDESIISVEAYANKSNRKSQGILKHLGLKMVKENQNNYHFRGSFKDLKKWYVKQTNSN